LAVVRTDGNRGVFVEDGVHRVIFSNVNTVRVGEGFHDFPIFVVKVVEAFREQE
jgi:hypothetical protein